MIRSLFLENLKCFPALRLDLARLTLLTGFNASGKSTSLQSLLLLAQTLRGRRGSAELRLNGTLTSLGSPADVLSGVTGAKSLMLGIGDAEVDLRWRFALDDESRRSLRIQSLEARSGSAETFGSAELDGLVPPRASDPVRRLLDAAVRTVFLGASRQVETEVFPIPLEGREAAGDVGVLGQHAAWWLYAVGDSEVDSSRRHPDAHQARTFRQQINAWCGELFPGAEINALPIPKTNLMRLELRSGPTADWSSPANIGYGISYAFPILVAALCANQGAPLIVDSPEAHLHPQGQSRIGRFLAHMAAAGSQIVVETHSDHLLNGVRLALRDGVIRPDDVAVFFFAPNAEAHVTRLSFDKNGTVSDWPLGFFDQSEKDLASLAGWPLS